MHHIGLYRSIVDRIRVWAICDLSFLVLQDYEELSGWVRFVMLYKLRTCVWNGQEIINIDKTQIITDVAKITQIL